jgi:PAS domain S-box-containing protein
MPQGLEEILHGAGTGIAQLDTGGRYVLVNESYCQILGRTREELLGLRLHDVTWPEDLPATLDAFIQAIETGVPLIIEQRCVHADGSAVAVCNHVSVGRDSQGKPQYVVSLAHEATAQAGQQAGFAQSDSDLRLLLDTAADGFYCLDREGRTTLCNAAFRRMLGFKQEADAIGKDLHEIIHHSHPDGSRYHREDCPILKVFTSGAHVHVIDEVFFRTDGSSFPVEYWARPIVRDGNIEGAVCTFVDLTERKNFEARQDLLNRELAHRMKNTLAIVQAIVGQTLRTASTPREATESIGQRLVALGNAHTILMRTRWGNASLIEVIESAVGIHRGQPHRFQVSGPRIDLGGKAALAITMALHELCTNAAKYGALSNERGKVFIEWSIAGGASDSMFELTWRERGGPAVKVPAHKGFGTKLISQGAGADLRGHAELEFAPDGVRWTLRAPVASLRQ